MTTYATYDDAQQPPAFPSDLPPRPFAQKGFKAKSRACFSYTLNAYNLRRTGGSKTVFARRLCNILVLLERFVLSIFNALVGGYTSNWSSGSYTASIVIGTILAVVGFISVAWCLATIDAAAGTRRVFGINFSRKFFDIFIYVWTFVNFVFFVAFFVALAGVISGIIWSVLWLLVLPVSWAATKPADHTANASNV